MQTVRTPNEDARKLDSRNSGRQRPPAGQQAAQHPSHRQGALRLGARHQQAEAGGEGGEGEQTDLRIAKWTMVLLTTTLTYETDTTELDKGEGDRLGKEEARKREVEDAVEYGLGAMRELLEVKEPLWYQMGLYLDSDEPAIHVARFGAPVKAALRLSNFGYASVEASKKFASRRPEDVSRQADGAFDAKLLRDECPLRGSPRCVAASRRYRTADGTCNNFNHPWRGAALLPMQRFLAPAYDDGIQSIRRSVLDRPLPSPREISTFVHRDKYSELPTVTLMLMQWGQFLDHDLVSTVKSRSFNGSVPRCCHRGGLGFLPPDLTHPSCLPIEIPLDDWFLGPQGIRCMEFIRSAPSTRIDCDLGYREQINQVTSFLDASTVYGSDVETSDAMRTFRNGKLQYGRAEGREPLQPPDPPGGELCRSGAITSDCLQGGDGRLSEQPGLTAMHTVWVRYHNKMAAILSLVNRHWSDEKVYQETRRIVIAMVQHITYREFLPIVLGQEVMDLFGLTLVRKGYYDGFDKRVNPAVANAFGAAAFRFGHSLVQNSFVRFDTQHRPIFNNVSLHEESENIENIWSLGSVDRILLGFANQRSQRRDEYVSDELSNHLFQSRGFPFGMDLTAVNIQRGRDHGLPAYTSWRRPCGLSTIGSFRDLERVMAPDTVRRLRALYRHVDDIDLFSGGLAEKPVKGGVVGPTFACIIAQQFLNLRKGDRFWYENGGFESSFTPAQLQQIRHVTLAGVMCQTLTEIETIQPFVFLVADGAKNGRVDCASSMVNNFDLSPWIEDGNNDFQRSGREKKKKRKVKRPATTTTTTTRKPTIKKTPVKIKLQTYNPDTYAPYDIPQRPTYDRYTDRPDVTYLFGMVAQTAPPPPTPKPFEVNIKIKYYPSTSPPRRPDTTYSDDFTVYRPTYLVRPPSTPSRPYVYPQNDFDRLYSDAYSSTYSGDRGDMPHPLKFHSTDTYDQFRFTPKTKFVKISSVKGEEYLHPSGATVQLHVAQREGDLDLEESPIRLVDIDMVPQETKWLVYNATEESMELLEIPDVNGNVSCSSEVPRPFNGTVTMTTLT